MELLQQSLFIPCGAHQLQVRHIQPRVAVHGEPILMVHGAIENGRIFYTESGKGLACFLARHGYQVYVADLRLDEKSGLLRAQDERRRVWWLRLQDGQAVDAPIP